jgi:hypothetical protein
MGTPNFYNQSNFKLYVQSFEPISLEEYEAEYFADDEYHYPEYEAAVSDEWKNRILEESYESTMRFWEETFYEDIYNGYDGFKTIMEDFNDTLTFHELKFYSGYYTGVQIFVEEKENPHELDNEDCNYYYDMCRSKAIRKYDAEVRKINKWMDKVAVQYGWQELICLGVFSNGEAVYKYADKIRDAVKAVHAEV